MNPPRGHRHAHRDPEQVLAQRRWVAPAQNGGYREVPELVLHHAIEGMGQCAQPEPECVFLTSCVKNLLQFLVGAEIRPYR